MDLSAEFEGAFDHVMLYEVGPFWDQSDEDVISGACDTREQRRKVGYVNIPADRGGETKYGIAKNSHPDLNIYKLDLDDAKATYYKEYWLRGECDQLPDAVDLIHFDGCTNHGIGRANKFLQRAVGTEPDGDIGPITLKKINEADPEQLVKSIANQRRAFYNAVVQRDSSQGVFLKGWLRRIDEVEAFTLAAL